MWLGQVGFTLDSKVSGTFPNDVARWISPMTTRQIRSFRTRNGSNNCPFFPITSDCGDVNMITAVAFDLGSLMNPFVQVKCSYGTRHNDINTRYCLVSSLISTTEG